MDKYFSLEDGRKEYLPEDTIPGRFLITTDTGDFYYEPEVGKRLQVGKQFCEETISRQTAASQFVVGNALSLNNVSSSQKTLDYLLLSRNQWSPTNEKYEYTINGTDSEGIITSSKDRKIAYYDQNLCLTYDLTVSEDITFVDSGVVVYLDIRYNDGCFETYNLISNNNATVGTKNLIIPAITHSGIRSYQLRRSALTFTGSIVMFNVRLTIGGSRQPFSNFISSDNLNIGMYSANIYGKNLLPMALFENFEISEEGVKLNANYATGLIAQGEYVAQTACTLIASMPEGRMITFPDTELLIHDVVLKAKHIKINPTDEKGEPAPEQSEYTYIYGEHTAVFHVEVGDIIQFELYVGTSLSEEMFITPMLELGLYATDWEPPIDVVNVSADVDISDYKNITLFPSDPNLMIVMNYQTTWKQYLDNTLGDISKLLQTCVEVGDLTEMLSTLVDGIY